MGREGADKILMILQHLFLLVRYGHALVAI
jgi:hypothetical protein